MDVERRYESFLVQYYAGVARDLPMISPFARDLVRRQRAGAPRWKVLVEAFHTDPFLAAKITGTSNSVFYARDHHSVLSIFEALRRVGSRYAYNLMLEAPSLPSGVDEDHITLLWAHCIAVAKTAKAVASAASMAPLPPDAAYLVAMIHDIGYLLQIHYSPNALLDVAAQLEGAEASAENYVHAHQGAELARFWFLPGVATSAIQDHHAPLGCKDANGRWLALVIALSEQLLEAATDAAAEAIDLEIAQELGVSRRLLPSLRVDAASAFRACLRRASLSSPELGHLEREAPRLTRAATHLLTRKART